MSAASLAGTGRPFNQFGPSSLALPRAIISAPRSKSSNEAVWLARCSDRCSSVAAVKIDIITLFPEICRAPLSESMMKRAQENGALDLHIRNLRDWTTDKHHVVDDAPFGGGQGMVMKPEPIFAAVEDLKSRVEDLKSKIVLMSP